MSFADTKEKVYEYLVTHAEEAPSVREMCSALNIGSTSTVFRAVHALEEEGKVRLKNGKRRNISLVTDSYEIKVPVLSSVDAEKPILAQENIETFITLNSSGKYHGELFAVRVKGDGMAHSGILNGDLAIARKADTAEEGDIVVVLSGDETAVKRFSADDAVLGKVVASYRYYE